MFNPLYDVAVADLVPNSLDIFNDPYPYHYAIDPRFSTREAAAQYAARVVFICNKLGIQCKRISIDSRGCSGFAVAYSLEILGNDCDLATCFIGALLRDTCRECADFEFDMSGGRWDFDQSTVRHVLKQWLDEYGASNARFDEDSIDGLAQYLLCLDEPCTAPEVSEVKAIARGVLLRALDKEYCRRG